MKTATCSSCGAQNHKGDKCPYATPCKKFASGLQCRKWSGHSGKHVFLK